MSDREVMACLQDVYTVAGRDFIVASLGWMSLQSTFGTIQLSMIVLLDCDCNTIQHNPSHCTSVNRN